jgi:hypothetical protein
MEVTIGYPILSANDWQEWSVNDRVVNEELMAVQRTLPSWKAYQLTKKSINDLQCRRNQKGCGIARLKKRRAVRDGCDTTVVPSLTVTHYFVRIHESTSIEVAWGQLMFPSLDRHIPPLFLHEII